jgi:ABC-2 type transport system permease protein
MSEEVLATTGPDGSGPRGSIYDLGYRSYRGARLGRAHAIRSLFWHSFRSTYGIGRGGRAKIAPIVLGGIASLPAVAFIGILTLAARAGLGGQAADEFGFNYATYYGSITSIVMLFCAAQAPELFGRDQRHGVLALYFARALRRTDYALARIAGFAAALLVLVLFPQTILFLGSVLLSEDVVGAIADNLPEIPAILGQGLLIAGLLGGLAMAISAFSPRRAYATVGIIAAFLIPGIVAGVIIGLGSSAIGDWLLLLSPGLVLDATNALLFDVELGSDFFFVNLPDWTYLAAALAGIAGSVAVAVRRFARIAA